VTCERIIKRIFRNKESLKKCPKVSKPKKGPSNPLIFDVLLTYLKHFGPFHYREKVSRGCILTNFRRLTGEQSLEGFHALRSNCSFYALLQALLCYVNKAWLKTAR